MSIQLHTISSPQEPAEFICRAIVDHLTKGERVLWLIPGGSGLDVVVQAAKLISAHEHHTLTVMLTDERHGSIGHEDSNLHQALTMGLSLPQARILPVLEDSDLQKTAQDFNISIQTEIQNADFKIGLFGIGADGHTAGILPRTLAIHSQDFAVGYRTDKFDRLTITPKVIGLLDEVVLYAMGDQKHAVLESLLTSEASIDDMPAVSLKEALSLTIFSDYKESHENQIS